MRFNPDCARDILIVVEAMEYNTTMSVSDIALKLPAYSEEQLYYHCYQLYSAGFIAANVLDISGLSLPVVKEIYDLTFSGHQFLSDVRSDKIWADTKSVAKSIGSMSLDVLSNIASKILTNIITNRLAL